MHNLRERVYIHTFHESSHAWTCTSSLFRIMCLFWGPWKSLSRHTNWRWKVVVHVILRCSFTAVCDSVSLLQERVVCERNQDPSRATNPAGSLSLWSCWSCNHWIFSLWQDKPVEDLGVRMLAGICENLYDGLPLTSTLGCRERPPSTVSSHAWKVTSTCFKMIRTFCTTCKSYCIHDRTNQWTTLVSRESAKTSTDASCTRPAPSSVWTSTCPNSTPYTPQRPPPSTLHLHPLSSTRIPHPQSTTLNSFTLHPPPWTLAVRGWRQAWSQPQTTQSRETKFLIDNLLVRIHLITEMILMDRHRAIGVWTPNQNSTPTTLNFRPYTLNPEPRPLNLETWSPKSPTLNPEPFSLLPQTPRPSTLKTCARSSGRTVSRFQGAGEPTQRISLNLETTVSTPKCWNLETTV